MIHKREYVGYRGAGKDVKDVEARYWENEKEQKKTHSLADFFIIFFFLAEFNNL